MTGDTSVQRDVGVSSIGRANHLVLEGARGTVAIQTGECIIEPGTIVRSDDGTRSLTVDPKDNTIVVRTPTNDILNFRVMEHEKWTAARDMGDLRRRFPHLRGRRTVRSPRAARVPGATMPLAFQVDMNTVHYETPFSMILPAGYSFKATPFTRIAIHIKSRAAPIGHVQGSEAAALECLREMVTEVEFRKYLTYGFVLVTGQSGRVYQVCRHSHHIKVWERGVLVERICVYLADRSVPPTDKVVAFKAMIEADEEKFKAMGNRYRLGAAA